MKLKFIHIGRILLGLIAELACFVKPLNRKYKISKRLCGPWPKGPVLWFHGASMGECRMLLNLAVELRCDLPHLPPILLTTQKAEVLDYLLKQNILAAMAPADVPWTLHKFIHRVKPIGLILGENELWPGYLSAMQKFTRSPSVALVSGRFQKAIPGTDFSSLGYVTLQTSADLNRFKKFSSRNLRTFLSVGGDWKLLPWARSEQTQNRQRQNSCTFPFSEIGCKAGDALSKTRNLTSFISVHYSEFPSLQCFLTASADASKSVVLAPRRLEEISFFRAALERLNLPVLEWPVTAPGSVTLVNCFGAVPHILSRSECAVVGGSFHPSLGIHDFWEPLQKNVTTYVGPFCRGHESAVNDLVSRGVLLQIRNPSDWSEQRPVQGGAAANALDQERQKILNSYLHLKMFLEELVK